MAFLPALATGLALAGCDRQNPAAPQGNAAGAMSLEDALATAAPPDGQRYPTGRLDRSRAGTPAPDVSFEDPEGRPVTMAAFRGRAVLVNLWATWCGPCIVEMPALDALAAREGDDLFVLTLSQDMDGRQKVTDFFAQRNFAAIEPYLDPSLDFMMTLRVDTLPTTILYDAEGKEVWRMTGLAEWGDERTTNLLREADAG